MTRPLTPEELTSAERFNSKVNRNGPVPAHCPELGACHVWMGTAYGSGYGCFWFKGKNHKAHRVAFFLAHGRWPTPCGLHKCDNRPCVNASHIFEGTYADNNADRNAKGRQVTARGERHGSSKLTEQDVIGIRVNAAEGVSRRELARRFGVAAHTVNLIVNGDTWTHV